MSEEEIENLIKILESSNSEDVRIGMEIVKNTDFFSGELPNNTNLLSKLATIIYNNTTLPISDVYYKLVQLIKRIQWIKKKTL